ncbi:MULTISPECIES: DUF3991 domain-containing protein [Caproicibacterium]|uniref:DUF3991 domain-containing protein n=1 Tax=Caproicibacterium argilliputei TaxID=3030016 RepID=A0AA97H2L8_9FIRM|nr:DUF3991 domain-containing protein [Caproicibacterium argilliputei]WOC32372.1 DUF3991 domain-containing protein [Caproicibacterium argilliputei]
MPKPSIRERLGNLWQSVRTRVRNFFTGNRQTAQEQVYQPPLQAVQEAVSTAEPETLEERQQAETVQQTERSAETVAEKNSEGHQEKLRQLIQAEAAAFRDAGISYEASRQIVEDSAKLYIETYAIADTLADNLLKDSKTLYQEEMQGKENNAVSEAQQVEQEKAAATPFAAIDQPEEQPKEQPVQTVTEKAIDSPTPSNDKMESMPAKLELPQKTAELQKHVFAFLNIENHIDKEIIKDVEKRGLLYQDNDRNAVFVSQSKDGKPVAAVQHTTLPKSQFTAEVSGSNPTAGWLVNNHANKLFVTETPVDAMALMTLRKARGENLTDANYLAVGKEAAASITHCLKENPQIEDVVLASGKTEIQDLTAEIKTAGQDLSVQAQEQTGGAVGVLKRKVAQAQNRSASPQTQQKTVSKAHQQEPVAPSL